MQPLPEPQGKSEKGDVFTTSAQHSFNPNTPNTASQPAPEAAAAAPPTPPNDPPEPPMDNTMPPLIRKKLDTREQTDPRADYPEDVQRLLRAAEMLIVGAHHKLVKNKPLSATETTMMKLLGVIPDGPN